MDYNLGQDPTHQNVLKHLGNQYESNQGNKSVCDSQPKHMFHKIGKWWNFKEKEISVLDSLEKGDLTVDATSIVSDLGTRE